MRVKLTLFAALLPATVLAAELDRQPYLQSTTGTGTTVVWRTDEDSDGELRWGPAPDTLDNIVITGTGRQHEARIEGLEPAAKVWYSVRVDGEVVAEGPDYFAVTNPPWSEPRRFRAWVVGDSGTGLLPPRRVRDAMVTHAGTTQPDLFLHLGDMAYSDGTDAEFTVNFFDVYADILRNTAVWPTLGNHEGRTSDSQTQSGPYYEGYVLPSGGEAGGLPSGTEAYYAFDHAHVHFVVLDSFDSPREPDGAMLRWLEQDLAATLQPWIVAFWHHPPYTKGSHDSDTEGNLRDMRENALPILEAAGVDLILGGHSHIYERSWLLHGGYETPSTDAAIVDEGDGAPGRDGAYRKDGAEGAVYVVAGHGGANVSRDGTHPLMYAIEAEYGSVLLDFDADRLSLRNVRADGVVTDRATLVHGPNLVVVRPNGGERLAAGTRVPIRWQDLADRSRVDIEWSCDGGVSWLPVVADLPDEGSYEWTVPAIASDAGLVRVSSGDHRDTSDGTFAMGSDVRPSLVRRRSAWRYWDRIEAPPAGWNSADFDDADWPEGDAPLGYGDADESTVVARYAPVRPSVYFRRTFTLDALPLSAELTLEYDDGASVWLNGQPIASVNVGSTAHDAWATALSSDNDLLQEAIDVAPFVLGDNVLAVVVKQVDATSTDLSFDLGLTGRLDTGVVSGPCPEPVVPPPPASSCACSEGSVDGGALLGLLLLVFRRRS